MPGPTSLMRLLACIAAFGIATGVFAQTLPEWRTLVGEELVYPRQARYTFPSRLPSEGASAEQNAQWLKVAQALAAAGLLEARGMSGRTLFEPSERAAGLVVPSVNMRYDTTALNVVIGQWDIEVREARREADVTSLTGRRFLTRPTRARDAVVQALGSNAEETRDREVRWEVLHRGKSLTISEKPP
jgi:hypothetical protein